MFCMKCAVRKWRVKLLSAGYKIRCYKTVRTFNRLSQYTFTWFSSVFMEIFKLSPRFCVLAHAFQVALRIYLKNIKSPAVEVNNSHFTVINFTNIHITTVPWPLFQPITINHSYLFTFLLILYGGQVGEFWETSKNITFFSPHERKCQSLLPITSPFHLPFYCSLTPCSLSLSPCLFRLLLSSSLKRYENVRSYICNCCVLGTEIN
jgi:hypothetical protein